MTNSTINKIDSYKLTESRPDENRNLNLDICRILAFFGIPAAHFFLYTGFYDLPVDSTLMFISVFFRNLFIPCLSVFMLLTGYLQGHKKLAPSAKYYFKIFKFLIPHFIALFAYIAFNYFYNDFNYGKRSLLNELFNFPGYSWYVEVYICLFLLIPFLNMIWHSLHSIKHELFLVITLVVLSILPTVVNVYDLLSDNWWQNSTTSNYLTVLPDSFNAIYPITYYFTGAFLHKHRDKIKIKPLYLFLVFVAIATLFYVYDVTRHYKLPPSVSQWIGRRGFSNYCISICGVLFITSIKFTRIPDFASKFISKLSQLSYSAYLISAVFDGIVYSKLNSMLSSFSDKIYYFPITVTIVIISSYISAFFIELISQYIFKTLKKLIFKEA